MKIHNKLFLILFSFSLILITVLVLLIQWSISRGMIEYVNNKESQELMSVIALLEDEYKQKNNWSTMHRNDQKFGNLLFTALKDSEVMMPPSPPEFRDPPLGDMKRNNGNRFNTAPPREINQRDRTLNERMGQENNSRANQLRRDQQLGSMPVPTIVEPISYALLDSNEDRVAGNYRKNADYIKIAITVDKHTVGWLAFTRRDTVTDGFELDYIEQQYNYLWIITLVMVLLVALISLFLARHIAEPIKLIMLGMHKLTQGDYQQHIDLKRKDELGELSRDFNELAITLDENDSARKRWLANISHELRTPLAILRGELEAMIDDVRPLSKNNIDSANDEVKHLQNLVDDLQQLTSADIGGMHYRKKPINISSWMNSEAKKYSDYLHSAGILLELNIENIAQLLFCDTTRLCQLFNNLINNSIKYSQASLMKISLKVDNRSAGAFVIITVEDNGVGVESQHLSSLFEHLFRVENSRNRKTGGSGLGLSICAHIVAAHQGKISAIPSNLGGLSIVIELPLGA